MYQALAQRIKMTRYTDYFLFHQIVRTGVPTTTTRIVRNYRDDGGGRVLIPITDAEASIDYFFAYRADSAERIEPLLRWITLCAADFRDSENA